MLCIIPARAGSKRLPGKNLRLLAGKPLIAHTIEVAQKSSLFESVYVCTEDKTIAEVARDFGASVPILMPRELCGDLIPSHIPCQRLAAHLAGLGHSADLLVCLQPTSPLRNVEDVKAAVHKFQSAQFDSLVTVTTMDPHDFHWAVVPNRDGYWHMYFGNQYLKERPLLPQVFKPNGSVKIARLRRLEQTGHFFAERMGAVETPPERSVHVALELDLKICELMLAERRE